MYIAAARAGFIRPDWSTAIHTLIEQEGNHAVVETVVTAYDHRGSGDEMPSAIFRIIFEGNRIESGFSAWQWPITEAWMTNILEKIIAVERDAQASAGSYFNVSVVSETLVDTGFGMNDDFGGRILIFELENISGRAVTVDISAVFLFDYGQQATLIDTNVRFEPNQARQFTHSFGEYVLQDALQLIIEYWNVRY